MQNKCLRHENGNEALKRIFYKYLKVTRMDQYRREYYITTPDYYATVIFVSFLLYFTLNLKRTFKKCHHLFHH